MENYKTKAQVKEEAQRQLLSAMQNAFTVIHEEYNGYTPEQTKTIQDEMSKQMARVEKIFGYEEYSWDRSC